ncbi:ATP synthase subunit g, mitochondrial [Trichonephila clavipes]|uniref:ATP synthase subunit g n=1 Tax=Trichonephila inaurata madagascariensis TaxID=2747483 RepID=A0A8X6YU11_9ARAC|nr:ATP synthase subunit g, mitochondrial [Trichonephila clavipes]GFY78398.1 ATP synthase subunit g, mitochondrial [Trichonephila inaurata madagascariensis]
MAKAVSSLGTKLPIMMKTMMENSKPKLETFVKYAKVELVPPKMSEMPEVMAGFGRLMRSAKSGAWKQYTMREAWLNTLVGLEIYFCFCIGECIGKGSLLGYQV